MDGTASLPYWHTVVAPHRLVALEKENRVLAFNAQEGRELLAVGAPRGRCPLERDVMRPFVMNVMRPPLRHDVMRLFALRS